MCLAIPGRLISITETDDPLARSGQVDFSGVRAQVSMAYVPEAKLNDYVIVHAGCALSVLDGEEAAASLQAFASLASAAN